jgi:hypothetical protein
MGRPFTLLEDLCRHALAMGADSIEVEREDGHDNVYGRKDGTSIAFASFAPSGADATELRDNLYRAHKKPMRTVPQDQVYVLKVRTRDSFGDDAFEVQIEPAPIPDPAARRFTKKQGQYLAFIYNDSAIHGVAPAEADLQRYFQVSAPSVHEMIKTLERNSLIERTAGRARSIRLIIPPKQLPQLDKNG